MQKVTVELALEAGVKYDSELGFIDTGDADYMRVEGGWKEVGKRGGPIGPVFSEDDMARWLKRLANRKPLALYYQAEDNAGFKSIDPTMNLQECEKFIERVLTDPTVIEKFGHHAMPEVEDGRGCKNASYTADYHLIKLPRWARYEFVVLHELAHLLGRKMQVRTVRGEKTVSWTCGGHGADFKRRLLWLVEEFIGAEESARLLDSYKALGCRI